MKLGIFQLDAVLGRQAQAVSPLTCPGREDKSAGRASVQRRHQRRNLAVFRLEILATLKPLGNRAEGRT